MICQEETDGETGRVLDIDARYVRLSAAGDPLEKLNALVASEVFRKRMGLFVRTIGIARARTKIGMANLAYNLTRFVWRQGRTASA